MQPLFTEWKRQTVVFWELQAKHQSAPIKIYTHYLNGYNKATYRISFHLSAAGKDCSKIMLQPYTVQIIGLSMSDISLKKRKKMSDEQ